MMKFIVSGNFSGRRIALFGTAASLTGGSKNDCRDDGYFKAEGCHYPGNYHCKGKFLLVNWGHPNDEDLKNAKKFAREMLNKG